MEDTLGAFEKIAPFLTQPLVLIGFVLMLFFSIHKQLLEANIIPKLTKQQGGRMVELILRYGFFIGVLIVLLGFAWKFYETYADTEVERGAQALATSENIQQIVAGLTQKHQLDVQTKDDQIKALTEAVTALSTGQGIVASPSELKEALAALARGNTTLAKSLFEKTAQKAEQQAKQGAEALRNLGALAFLENTQEALQAYRRATQLDPDNADGWDRLGHLLLRVGDLNEATAAYKTVLALGEKHGDKQAIAVAYGNLGNVCQSRGELDQAIEFYQKALRLDEALGSKGDMAAAYGNLGLIYRTRGELDRAIELHQKSLRLHEALDRKEGMANNYTNLGIVYQT
ncbi:MAG: tetratricopeptide repeat protein, partial [Methylococcales bacterium]